MNAKTDIPVDTLVRELLDTGTMNEDSVADLERMLAEWRAGELHPDDADYLVAFHRRILGTLSDAPPAEPEDAPSAAPDEITRLRTDLAAALDRAEKAEAEVARLTALLAEREADQPARPD